MSKKKESAVDKARREVEPWLVEKLASMVGKRSLNEFLWSPSALWRLWLTKRGETFGLETKEFRLAFISWIHHWISEHRLEIIQAWNEKLRQVSQPESWELVRRHYEKMREKRDGQ